MESPSRLYQILDIDSFQDDYPALYKKSILFQDAGKIRFCQIIDYQSVLSGTFLVPIEDYPIKDRWEFAFVLDQNRLYFLCSRKHRPNCEHLLKDYQAYYLDSQDREDPPLFLIRLMLFMIRDDVYYLEIYNKKLEELEEDEFRARAERMEKEVLETRKSMEILSSYYLQLSAAAEVLEKAGYDRRCPPPFETLVHLYETKVSQLHGMVENIKSYTDQIFNLRQSRLSDKQNKITTVLTIITTIFLPLTLVTGWFGQNFYNLPFIRDKDGWIITLGLCIAFICLEIFYIWKKNWFK